MGCLAMTGALVAVAFAPFALAAVLLVSIWNAAMRGEPVDQDQG